jgi:hypothetical protein
MLQHLPQYLMTRVSDCSATLQVPTVCRSATSSCCSCPQVVHVSVFFKSFPSPSSSSNRPGSSGSQRRTLSSGLSSSRHFPWRRGSSYLQHQGRWVHMDLSKLSSTVQGMSVRFPNLTCLIRVSELVFTHIPCFHLPLL